MYAESAKGLYEDLIKKDNHMSYLPFDKISQDHIEIFLVIYEVMEDAMITQLSSYLNTLNGTAYRWNPLQI